LSNTHQILIRKLREHSRLTGEDLAEINALGLMLKELKPNEDLIRQGDDPDVSAVVVSGFDDRALFHKNSRYYPGAIAAGRRASRPILVTYSSSMSARSSAAGILATDIRDRATWLSNWSAFSSSANDWERRALIALWRSCDARFRAVV
jgi:hypothetical protein